jgi:hypothetical protein
MGLGRNRFIRGCDDQTPALSGDCFALTDEKREFPKVVVAFGGEIHSHRTDLVDFRGRFHG